MSLSESSALVDSLEFAGTMLERHDIADCSTPGLLEVRMGQFNKDINCKVPRFLLFWKSYENKKHDPNLPPEAQIRSHFHFFQVTGIKQSGMATASGLNDYDYQNLSSLSLGLKNLNQLATVNKIPIPPEIMEHFKRKCCLMLC